MDELERILREGATLHEAGHYDEALALYDEALARWSSLALLWNNRGNTLLELGLIPQAIKSYQQALQLEPSLHDSRVALATCLQAAGEVQQALAECTQVLKVAPDHAEAHWNFGLLLLLQGDYTAGFREYEWRWKKRRFTSPVRQFSQPRWQGTDPAGKIILIYAEQGYGDVLQFCRYLPLLVKRGAEVLFECHQPLVTIMQTLGPGITVVPFGSPLLLSFEYHAPLLSLPYLFGSTFETIPATVPYLTVPEARLPFWRSVMPASSTCKTGLCWAGKSYPDPGRSCQVELLKPLMNLSGLSWVSLQMTENSVKPFSLIDLTMLVQDFADTAALLAQLDLVITIDTAVAHLAGALGKETWLMVPFAPDWRWGLNRTDCPWYPTIRLFRQERAGAWETVIEQVREALVLRA